MSALLGVAFTLANLFILALNLKLYTEFAKQRMQETRKQEPKP